MFNLTIDGLFNLSVMMILLYFLNFIFFFILITALLTLIERKIIASVQRRKGPDFIGFWGLIQPVTDALKLITKKIIIPKTSYFLGFIIAPILSLLLSLLSWAFLPLSLGNSFLDSELTLLWFLAVSSIGVYGIFLAGWSSNSKYAFLGSLRSVAQIISYELSISILLLPIVFSAGSLSVNSIILSQSNSGVINLVLMFPSAFLMLICILAETNRAPFDMPEAEAELVAGYNVEYSSLPFAIFFLAEYLNIISMSILFSILFLGGNSDIFLEFSLYTCLNFIFFYFKVVLVIFFIIWIRATLPRVRYDYLMGLFWKHILLFSFSYFIFFIGVYAGFCYII